jgi:hypothetical protein
MRGVLNEMTFRIAPFILLAAGLTACAPAIMAHAGRKEALSAISRVMAEEHPTLATDRAALCVLRSMSIAEIATLGVADNYKQVSVASRAKIATYAARPKAETCLADLPEVATE